MTVAVEVAALLLVAAGSTAAVLVRRPVRQALVYGFYGLLLVLLFVVLRAPGVALSQLVVGAVAIPVLALLTLTKIREEE